MSTRIAFLRAVNVGRRRVAMSTVVEVCRQLGYDDVWTHANSGNAVFDATGRRATIEGELAAALEAAVGFEVSTFVRTAKELTAAVTLRPFHLDPADTYFITFLARVPPARVAAELVARSNDFDTVEVHGRDVHWRMRGPSLATTLTAAAWRPLGEHASTSRNVNLLTKLDAKIRARDER